MIGYAHVLENYWFNLLRSPKTNNLKKDIKLNHSLSWYKEWAIVLIFVASEKMGWGAKMRVYPNLPITFKNKSCNKLELHDNVFQMKWLQSCTWTRLTSFIQTEHLLHSVIVLLQLLAFFGRSHFFLRSFPAPLSVVKAELQKPDLFHDLFFFLLLLSAFVFLLSLAPWMV